MEVSEVVIKSAVVNLTPNEASWLKSVMQNPLWGQTPEEEDSFDKEMRSKLFHSLNWS